MLTQEQYDKLLPKPRKEITCEICGEKWKFFHKCEKYNQPERSKREDAKIYAGTLPDKLNWCDPTTL